MSYFPVPKNHVILTSTTSSTTSPQVLKASTTWTENYRIVILFQIKDFFYFYKEKKREYFTVQTFSSQSIFPLQTYTIEMVTL